MLAWSLVLAFTAVVPVASTASTSTVSAASTFGAQASDDSVRLTLDRVSPSVAKPGQTVSLVGSIENVSQASITLGSARVSTQDLALDTPAKLDAWLAGEHASTASAQVGRRALSQRLSPGQSTGFTLTIPVGALSPPFSFASLPLLLEISADDGTILDRTHTVLPWYAAAPPVTPLSLSWVVPLTVPAEPALTSTPGDERTAAWLDAIGEGSPARAWLDGLQRYNPTFMVDPALLVPSASAADISAAAPTEQVPLPTSPAEPTVSPTQTPTSPLATSTSPEGEPAETSAPSEPSPLVELPDEPTRIQEAEARVQNRLSQVPSDQLWWLPVADPDLAALVDIGAGAQMVDDVLNADLPPSVLEAEALVGRGRHDIAWPVWSQINAARLDAVHALGSALPLSTVLVPRSTFADSSGLDRKPTAVRRTTTGEVTLLGYDDRLSELVATMPTASADGEQIQAVLAYTLARYQRTPADPGAVVVAPSRTTAIEADTVSDLGAALRTAPWVTQVPAATLLEDAVSTSSTDSSLTTTALTSPPPSPLSLTEIDRIEGLRDTLDQVSGILPSAVAVRRWKPVLNGLYSTRWRTNPDGWSMPLAELESQVEIVINGVRINPTDVNFLAQEGLIQITLINDLPVPVQDLQLTLDPGNGRLRIIDQPAPISIGAQSRANVQFRARAVAAGEVPVRATLSTPSGLVIGETQVVDVQVRPTGMWIYWVLGGVAGVILVLGLTRALRRPRPHAEQGRA